jgi:cytochrome d ubiquinol oxidase subunit I
MGPHTGFDLTDLFFARSQMALSLAFHIVFAAVGIGMPLLMAVAEGLYLRRREALYRDLARRWANGTAILAVGAVSGTVLSFELGLLWPGFMEYAGGIIGMPFSLEGFAFFTEAIFLGIYLYGWDRIPPLLHWLAGIMVAVSGMASGVFVVTVNAWMNAPTGFDVVDGRVTNIDPIAAMLNPASLHQVIHMILAAYVATAFAVAAVHAFFLLRDRANAFHRRAFAIALTVAAIGSPLQIVSGDLIARMVAVRQPAKFAAMEAHYRTEAGAPLTIGGIPDDATMTTRYAIRIPFGLSLLAWGDPRATVRGLDSVPRDEWPNTRIVHWAFDVMVGAGVAMLAVADARPGHPVRDLHDRLRLPLRQPRLPASPPVPGDAPGHEEEHAA